MTLPNQGLVSLSAWLLFGTFLGYLIATVLYISGLVGARMSRGARFSRATQWGSHAHLVAVGLHFTAILARWQGSGHWPTSNMYEFIGFLAFTSMVAFQVINRMYRMPIVGAVVSPVGLILLAYSYVFPVDVAPLVPALRSYWLPVHVSTVALGSGFFAVAFGTSLMYLLRIRGKELDAIAKGEGISATAEAGPEKTNWNVRGMEILVYLTCVIAGFILLANVLRHLGFQWVFDRTVYHLPPIIGPAGAAVGSKGDLFGFIPMPLVSVPAWLIGKQVNTLLYSLGMGWILYSLARRLAGGRPLGDVMSAKVSGSLEMYDEVSYRAVAIGYPIYTLGALVFAMLWAKEAWGRYWFWDPKETWALITWLVFSVYLHLRITKGWEGRKAAWVAMLGFGVLLFTLVGVNLLIVGLHSYAGGDR